MGQTSQRTLYQRTRAYFAIKGLRYWLLASLIVLSSFILTPYAESYVHLSYLLFGNLIKLDPRAPEPAFTQLVYIDEAEHNQLGARTPLDRNYLKKIITRLDDYNAHLIALDFILLAPDPNAPLTVGDFRPVAPYVDETNNLMREILRVAEHRRIVLGKSIHFDKIEIGQKATSLLDVYQPYGICVKPKADGNWYSPGTPDYPLTDEARAHLRCGYLNLPRDLREFPMLADMTDGTRMDSFAIAIARLVKPDVQDAITDDAVFTGYFLQHARGSGTIISSSRLLGPDNRELRSLIEGKVVIVGGHWKSAQDPDDFVDMHDTPIGHISGTLVHQNFVEALLDRRLYSSVGSTTLEILLAIAAAFVFAEVHRLWAKASLLAGGVFGLLLIQWLMFSLFYRYFDASLPVLGLGLHSIIERLFEPRDAHHGAGPGAGIENDATGPESTA